MQFSVRIRRPGQGGCCHECCHGSGATRRGGPRKLERVAVDRAAMCQVVGLQRPDDRNRCLAIVGPGGLGGRWPVGRGSCMTRAPDGTSSHLPAGDDRCYVLSMVTRPCFAANKLASARLLTPSLV